MSVIKDMEVTRQTSRYVNNIQSAKAIFHSNSLGLRYVYMYVRNIHIRYNF